MSDPLFQEAYARARKRFGDEGWLALNPRQITDAIYEEIRQIDAERVAAVPSVARAEAAEGAARTKATTRQSTRPSSRTPSRNQERSQAAATGSIESR
jgi:hypothetical protein